MSLTQPIQMGSIKKTVMESDDKDLQELYKQHQYNCAR